MKTNPKAALLIPLFLLLTVKCESVKDILGKLQEIPSNLNKQTDSSLVTMAFFTPWNSKGMDTTLKYKNKFDIISPVWFDMKPENLKGKYNTMIDGSNNINNSFLKNIRESNPKPLIVPRFMCSGFNVDTLKLFLLEENFSQLIKVIIRRLKYSKFDGMVLECNSIWLIEELYSSYSIFIQKLSESLRAENKKLIITGFPYSESFANVLTKQRFEYLTKYFDYFFLMSYDYLEHNKSEIAKKQEMFISPITWIEKTIEHFVDMKKSNHLTLLNKIILGIPFHGIMVETGNFDPEKGPRGSILEGERYVEILKQAGTAKPIWSSKEKEHTLDISTKDGPFKVVYPTNRFIQERIAFAKDNNLAGVGIWEVSQGVDSLIGEF